MNRVNFFSGQKVSAEDLNYLQETICNQINTRTGLQYSKGVISDKGTYVEVDVNQTLKIKELVALTPSGDMIQITSDIRGLALDLTNSSDRRLGTQGLLSDEDFGWEVDTPYYIVIRYTEAGGRPRPHYRTRVSSPTRIYSGFEAFAIRKGIDPMENSYIKLADAIYQNDKLSVYTEDITEYAGLDASKIIVDLSSGKTSTYNPSSRVSVEDHIKSIGDINAVSPNNPHGITPKDLGIDVNAVPEHEKLFHAEGFLGDYASVDSCFYTTVDVRSNPEVDRLKVYNLNSERNESLHANGKTIYSYNYSISSSDEAYIPPYVFIAMDSSSPNGDYTLYVDISSGKLKVSYPGTLNSEIPPTYSIISLDGTTVLESGLRYLSDTSSLDLYKLFSFNFNQDKRETNIDLGVGNILSNFRNLEDSRLFGSINSANLQKNTKGVADLGELVRVNSIIFHDDTILNSAIMYPADYISSSLKYESDGESLTIFAGICKDSTNKTALYLRRNLVKDFTSFWEPNSSGCLPPNIPISSGTWHIFVIGKLDGSTDVAIDRNIRGANLVNPDSVAVSPLSGFKYIRRIGSFFVLNNNTTIPFTTYNKGNGLVTVFKSSDYADAVLSNNKDILSFPVPVMDSYNWDSNTHSWVPEDPKYYYENIELTLNISRYDYSIPESQIMIQVVRANADPSLLDIRTGMYVKLNGSNKYVACESTDTGALLVVEMLMENRIASVEHILFPTNTFPGLNINTGNMDFISCTGNLICRNISHINAKVVSYYDARTI